MFLSFIYWQGFDKVHYSETKMPYPEFDTSFFNPVLIKFVLLLEQ